MSYLNGVGKEICGHCNIPRTPEGHDGCIGTLENVRNACCGHGETKMAYVQFNHNDYENDPNKIRLTGQEALNHIKKRNI